MTRQSRNTGLLTAAPLSLGAGIGLFAANRQQPAGAMIEGLLRPNPKTPAPFTAVEHQQKPFTRDNLQDKWSFLFFGYAHRPEARPTPPAIMNQASRRLADMAEAQTVFASVDPRRDAPVRLAQRRAGFNPGFIGISGSVERMAQPAGRSGAACRPDENGDIKGRLPSASLFLIDPRGRFTALFSAPHDAARIARWFRRIQQFIDA